MLPVAEIEEASLFSDMTVDGAVAEVGDSA